MKTLMKHLLYLSALLVLAVSTAQAAGTWQQVGAAGFSAAAANYISFAIGSGGTPYVAYRDWANSGKASVMKFDGSNWVQVGQAGFAPGMGVASDISLAVAGGTPYIAYQDGANSGKASVMKFADTPQGAAQSAINFLLHK